MKKICRKLATLLVIFTVSFSFTIPLTTYAASGDTTVYVTATGSKYHSAGCRYLKRSCYSISLQDAIDQNYTACSVCNPPTLTKSSKQTTGKTGTKSKTSSKKAGTSTVSASESSTIPAWFDATFYANTYPDVVAGLKSSDPQILYNHYLQYGITEGRFPSAAAMTNALAALKSQK
ncbi:MAG: hypothetical protein LKF52_15130 [Butyrivibrio sp.]|jgi:hypothetical protein|nr:hypothetical protein [Butyrivibrio sp.]